jgi:predicted nucleic acid-binding protein
MIFVFLVTPLGRMALADSIGAILDTSFFIAREQRRPLGQVALPRGLAVSVVTLAELRVAVLNERTGTRPCA